MPTIRHQDMAGGNPLRKDIVAVPDTNPKVAAIRMRALMMQAKARNPLVQRSASEDHNWSHKHLNRICMHLRRTMPQKFST